LQEPAAGVGVIRLEPERSLEAFARRCSVGKLQVAPPQAVVEAVLLRAGSEALLELGPRALIANEILEAQGQLGANLRT
jgi:hypothetical protein